MPVLSIIVPVYKVENYLRRCIDSILAQTFKDYELILVNDGSPDNCPQICEEYAVHDERIKVIHKQNGGLADARNAGLEIATGDYIGFVDSDDSILPDMYQTLINSAQQYDADIAVCGILNLDQTGNIIGKWPDLQKDKLYERKDFIDHFHPDVRRDIMPSVANKIFKHFLFEQIHFPVGKIYEDAYIQLLLLDQCSKVIVCHNHFYQYYYARPESIINTTYSEKNISSIDFAYQQYSFFINKNLKEQQEYALHAYVNNYLQNFFKIKFEKPDLYPKFMPYKKQFRLLLPKILCNSKICRLKKIAIIAIYLNKKFALELCKKYFPECFFEKS